MKKSFVAAKLNLTVSNKVNERLAKAESKLLDAVVSNYKVKEKAGVINKILKENNIVVNAKELKACLDEFKTNAKEFATEYSISKKEHIQINLSPDELLQNGFSLDLTDALEFVPEGDVEDIKENPYVEIVEESTVDEEDENEEKIEVTSNTVINTFTDKYLKTFSDELLDNFEIPEGWGEIIYNILQGNIVLSKVSGAAIDMFKDEVGIFTYKLLEPFICQIIETLDSAVYDLNILSSSSDMEFIQSAFDRYYDYLVDKFMTLASFFGNKDNEEIKELTILLLLGMLNENLCRNICFGDKPVVILSTEEVYNAISSIIKSQTMKSNETHEVVTIPVPTTRKVEVKKETPVVKPSVEAVKVKPTTSKVESKEYEVPTIAKMMGFENMFKACNNLCK